MVDGCDGIVHLVGVSVESTFQNILQGNLIGLYNLYEAARFPRRVRRNPDAAPRRTIRP